LSPNSDKKIVPKLRNNNCQSIFNLFLILLNEYLHNSYSALRCPKTQINF
jgi:hypothetical protein